MQIRPKDLWPLVSNMGSRIGMNARFGLDVASVEDGTGGTDDESGKVPRLVNVPR